MKKITNKHLRDDIHTTNDNVNQFGGANMMASIIAGAVLLFLNLNSCQKIESLERTVEREFDIVEHKLDRIQREVR